jgi:DNA polymerase-3 subunit gamma/tau
MLLGGSQQISPMIIERFFRVLAESMSLLNMGADGQFTLSLTLFKMMEALQIKEIDGMIRTLEKELSGVTVSSQPVQKIEKRVTPLVHSEPKEEIKEKEEPVAEPVIEKKVDAGGKLFEELIVKMYDRNYDLGECFKYSIEYVSFENHLLTWESSANREQKTLLKNNWMTIRTFVQDIFGYETKIKNLSKELPSSKVVEKVEVSSYNSEMEEPLSMVEDELLNQSKRAVEKEESEPMTSSCVAGPDEAEEASKEKDERTILDEPMVAKALELFAPKKVRVKRK